MTYQALPLSLCARLLELLDVGPSVEATSRDDGGLLDEPPREAELPHTGRRDAEELRHLAHAQELAPATAPAHLTGAVSGTLAH